MAAPPTRDRTDAERAAQSVLNNGLIETINTLHKEGRGFLTVEVFLRKDLNRLRDKALRGDNRLYNSLLIVGQIINTVTAVSDSEVDHMLCAACDARIMQYRFNIVIVRSEADQRTPRLGLPICFACGNDNASVCAAGHKALKNIWPDSVEKKVTHPEGGHA